MSLKEQCPILHFGDLGDERGKLVVIEGGQAIPFEIKRVFYIYDSDDTVVRGQHANRESEFVLVNVAGESKVRITDGTEEMVVKLDKPMMGVYIPKMLWKDMYDFSRDSVLLVLANTRYDGAEYIRDYDEYLKKGSLNPLVLSTDTNALNYQIPGGMLSNLVAQLTAQNKMDKFNDVLLETPKVRKDLGYPPLVTPMSQMVGVQATVNVLVGERYKNISKEVKAYIKGEYGRAPGEIDKDLMKKVLGDEEPIKGRFADTLEPGFEKAKKEIGEKAKSDEDVLSYIAFPTQAEAFFDKREEKEKNTFKYSIKRID